MKKIILIFSLLVISMDLLAQMYDTKYSAEYVAKDTQGNSVEVLKHFRSGDKLKFVQTRNNGENNEATIETYVNKKESKVYIVESYKNFKYGSIHSLDMNFIGLRTRIYILDLGNDGSQFNNTTNAGPEMVNGRECIRYDMEPPKVFPNKILQYYIYQDNLMLKMVAGNDKFTTTFEAVSYIANADVPDSIFTLPSGVNFYNDTASYSQKDIYHLLQDMKTRNELPEEKEKLSKLNLLENNYNRIRKDSANKTSDGKLKPEFKDLGMQYLDSMLNLFGYTEDSIKTFRDDFKAASEFSRIYGSFNNKLFFLLHDRIMPSYLVFFEEFRNRYSQILKRITDVERN